MIGRTKLFAAACAAFAALAAPFAPTSVMAREPAPAVTAPPAIGAPVEEVATPALWKVADADTTIYLFGTVHALPPNIGWYNGKVSKAFEGSHELVTEIAGMDQTAMQRIVMSKAMLPQGKTLRSLLRPEQRATFEAALAQYKVPPAAFDGFKPWYAAVALATLPLMKEGLATENGVDKLLEDRAKARGLKHTGLETAEYQLGLFDGLPAEVQDRYLAEVVRTLPEVKQKLTDIIAAWKSGDATRLAALINDGEDEPAMLEALLIGRNRHWADWIKKRLDTPGTVFMAVGAGHLAGTGSVQDQLKTRGLTATRVQ